MTRYRKCVDLAVVSRGDRVFVARLSGDVTVLRGNAAVIWECVDGASTGDVIHRVAQRAGRTDEEVAPETEAFLASLCRDGLLTDD